MSSIAQFPLAIPLTPSNTSEVGGFMHRNNKWEVLCTATCMIFKLMGSMAAAQTMTGMKGSMDHSPSLEGQYRLQPKP